MIAGALLVAAATLLPGLAAVAWTRPGTSLAGALGAALALSPLLGGAAVALLVAARMPWDSALILLLALSAILAILGARRDGGFATAFQGEGRGPRAAWIAAATGVIVLGGMFAASEWWQIYNDAWTHAPIVRALLDHGVPPPDPWYAGFRLQYAWLYHAWVAALVAATGLSPFGLMSWLAVVSFAALALVAGDLAQRLHGRTTGWTTALLVLGLNGAFVFTLPVVVGQALYGTSGSPELLQQAFAGVTANSDRASDLLRWFGAQTWFGNKFAGATPLSLGLAALTAWMAALWRGLESGRARAGELALLGLCAACAGLTHPVLLLFLAATTALWVAIALLAPAGPRGATIGALAPPALATAVGLVPAGLYFARILAPSASHLAPPFDLSGAKLLGLALSTLPAFACVAFGARAFAARGEAHRLWLAWLLGAVVFAVLLRLPGTWAFFTVDKTSYLLWIPLALTGGAAFAAAMARLPRALAVLLAALILVPPTALALSARARDPRGAWRQPWRDPGIVALARALPRDALLVVPPGDIDTPVFLARDTYDEDKIDGLVRGYAPAELTARHALVDSLYRAGKIPPQLLARLAATGRPAFAIWPDHTGPAWQKRTPGVPQRLFECEGPMPTFPSLAERFGDAYTVVTLVPPREAR